MTYTHACPCLASSPFSSIHNPGRELCCPRSGSVFPSHLMQWRTLLLSPALGKVHPDSSPSRLSSHTILACVKLRITANLLTQGEIFCCCLLDSAILILHTKGGWPHGKHDVFGCKISAVTLHLYCALFLKFGSPVLTHYLLFGKLIMSINLGFPLCITFLLLTSPLIDKWKLYVFMKYNMEGLS